MFKNKHNISKNTLKWFEYVFKPKWYVLASDIEMNQNSESSDCLNGRSSGKIILKIDSARNETTCMLTKVNRRFQPFGRRSKTI